MSKAVHNGFIGQSGVQNHSAGSDYPVIVAIIGDYPTPDNGGVFEVSNQGVSRRVSDCAGRDRCVDRHKNAERIADLIWQAYTRREGCTVPADGSDCPDTGYCVGLAGHETQFGFDGLTYKLVYADVFIKLERIGLYGNIGSWVHDGRLYIDVSAIVADRTEAFDLAFCNSQLAIFDIDNGADLSCNAERVRRDGGAE